jgi:hypothetical protein
MFYVHMWRLCSWVRSKQGYGWLGVGIAERFCITLFGQVVFIIGKMQKAVPVRISLLPRAFLLYFVINPSSPANCL